MCKRERKEKTDTSESEEKKLPESPEELQLHMQLTYKQSIEIAEEQALNILFEGNNYELIKKQFYSFDMALKLREQCNFCKN